MPMTNQELPPLDSESSVKCYNTNVIVIVIHGAYFLKNAKFMPSTFTIIIVNDLEQF